MGGFGSGKSYYKRRATRSKKFYVGSLPEISISELIKMHKESPSSKFILNGIELTVKESSVNLYILEVDKKISYSIRFAAMPCHFGGFRYFWHCPVCQKRAITLHLFLNLLACRSCFKMCYLSQNATLSSRLYTKRKKVKEKLNGDLWKKPERMRKKTFKKLRNQHFDLERMDGFADMFSLRNNYAANAFLKKFHAPEFVPDEIMTCSGKNWRSALLF